ncbi:MAG: hypothetical protein PHP50_01505 [Lachnospiraceae bacterium]|nr:hypothetical protein [Lachnospiraceae bacterium]
MEKNKAYYICTVLDWCLCLMDVFILGALVSVILPFLNQIMTQWIALSILRNFLNMICVIIIAASLILLFNQISILISKKYWTGIYGGTK